MSHLSISELHSSSRFTSTAAHRASERRACTCASRAHLAQHTCTGLERRRKPLQRPLAPRPSDPSYRLEPLRYDARVVTEILLRGVRSVRLADDLPCLRHVSPRLNETGLATVLRSPHVTPAIHRRHAHNSSLSQLPFLPPLRGLILKPLTAVELIVFYRRVSQDVAEVELNIDTVYIAYTRDPF